VNSPLSSAAGRVFDAAAALVLGIGATSFEGQGPMWLEAIARDVAAFPELPVAEDAAGLARVDWAPLIEWLCASAGRDPAERAGVVHAALADAIVRVAERERAACGAATVGLTGGVFQNRRLTELASAALLERGFTVLLPQRIPCNDGGLSYGQVADFAGRSD
jgi:hydrogenase maturation protein HypF